MKAPETIFFDPREKKAGHWYRAMLGAGWTETTLTARFFLPWLDKKLDRDTGDITHGRKIVLVEIKTKSDARNSMRHDRLWYQAFWDACVGVTPIIVIRDGDSPPDAHCTKEQYTRVKQYLLALQIRLGVKSVECADDAETIEVVATAFKHADDRFAPPPLANEFKKQFPTDKAMLAGIPGIGPAGADLFLAAGKSPALIGVDCVEMGGPNFVAAYDDQFGIGPVRAKAVFKGFTGRDADVEDVY